MEQEHDRALKQQMDEIKAREEEVLQIFPISSIQCSSTPEKSRLFSKYRNWLARFGHFWCGI